MVSWPKYSFAIRDVQRILVDWLRQERPDGKRTIEHRVVDSLFEGVAQKCAENARMRVLRQFDLEFEINE